MAWRQRRVPLQHGRLRPKSRKRLISIANAFRCRAGGYCWHDTHLGIDKIVLFGDPATPSSFLLYRSDLSADTGPKIEKIAYLLDGVRCLRSPNPVRELHLDGSGTDSLTVLRGGPVDRAQPAACASIHD